MSAVGPVQVRIVTGPTPMNCPACGRDMRRCVRCGMLVSQHHIDDPCRSSTASWVEGVDYVLEPVAYLDGKPFCSLACGQRILVQRIGRARVNR